MIKLCMIVHQYYHRDPRVQRYAEALADAGVQVDILALRDPDPAPRSLRDGIRVHTIPLSRGYKQQGSYLLEYGIACMLFTLWLLKLYIRNGYQVIHVNNMPDFLVFTALLPWLCGSKVILDIHDPMPEVYASKYVMPRESTAVRLMRWQEQFSARFAHAVVTANSNFRENLIKRGIPADKITVVNNVADPRVFNRSAYEHLRHVANDRFTLIYPGTIAHRYGLDVAIRALPLLVKQMPHIRLLIIGTRVAYVDELAALAEQLGVAAYVEFHPVIPVREVPAQMVQADIGIYPAYCDAHMNIATPTKVLEYAVMGLPIVTARLKVLEDFFSEDAVMFFEPGNVEQFAQCVLTLYNDPTRRAELVRTADQVYVAQHTWSTERNAYFALLNRLLAARGATRITYDTQE